MIRRLAAIVGLWMFLSILVLLVVAVHRHHVETIDSPGRGETVRLQI